MTSCRNEHQKCQDCHQQFQDKIKWRYEVQCLFTLLNNILIESEIDRVAWFTEFADMISMAHRWLEI
jgi:hypothetical protein